jgi:hypothetical protein
LNELQRLITETMAKDDLSFRQVSERSTLGWPKADPQARPRVSAPRVQQLATRERLARMPRFDILEGLADALRLPLRMVWESAAMAVSESDPRVRQWLYAHRTATDELFMASYDELSPEQRSLAASFVEMLRRQQGGNPPT